MATPLQAEIAQTVKEFTVNSTDQTSKGLRGDDLAIFTEWFKIATEGKNPSIAMLSKRCGFTEADVALSMAKPEMMVVMERVGHGVVDVVQLAVALRVANELERLTRAWQMGEIPFSEIPKAFQELALEAYRSKIPETRAKQAQAKAPTDGKEPKPISAAAMRLLATEE